MADDFFIRNAQERYAELQADLAQVEAGLMRAKTEGNDYSARELISGRAGIQAEMRALNDSYQEHIRQSQQVPERESIMDSKRLPSNGDDALEIVNYGKRPSDRTWISPEEYNAQLAKLQYLKTAKGMYKD
jgi:hypothetical protein